MRDNVYLPAAQFESAVFDTLVKNIKIRLSHIEKNICTFSTIFHLILAHLGQSQILVYNTDGARSDVQKKRNFILQPKIKKQSVYALTFKGFFCNYEVLECLVKGRTRPPSAIDASVIGASWLCTHSGCTQSLNPLHLYRVVCQGTNTSPQRQQLRWKCSFVRMFFNTHTEILHNSVNRFQNGRHGRHDISNIVSTHGSWKGLMNIMESYYIPDTGACLRKPSKRNKIYKATTSQLFVVYLGDFSRLN